MNVLFLSPHFPPNFKHFIFALRDAGAKVLGMGDAPPHEVPDELKRALVEYVCVPDMFNRYDAMRDTVADLATRQGRIDRIDSQNEHWLEHEARLRDEFDIFGQRMADVNRNRRKLGMKDFFREAGVPVAPAEGVTSVEQCRVFANHWGFPLILKPDVGVGASGTQRVDNVQQLERALDPLPKDTIIEKFVTGKIVTFDGLADRDCNPIFWTSHVYSAGIMEIVSQRLTFHYYNFRDIPPALEQHGRRIVQRFGVRERFFHIELFETQANKYHALEINVRPPGGFTMDMMNYSADVDLYKVWARLVVHNENELTFERKYHVAHVGRRDEVKYKLSHDQVMKDLGVKFAHHPHMPPLWRPVMGDSVYLIGDPKIEALKRAIAMVEEIA
jgi:biotin carboxylase